MNYIYKGNKFPSYTGKKVTITEVHEGEVLVKVVDEETVIEGSVWGTVFYCKKDDLERVSND